MRLKSRWWRILILQEYAGSVVGITYVGWNLDWLNKVFSKKTTSAELQEIESEAIAKQCRTISMAGTYLLQEDRGEQPKSSNDTCGFKLT